MHNNCPNRAVPLLTPPLSPLPPPLHSKPNEPDHNGDTPIKIAAKRGYVLCLDELLVWHLSMATPDEFEDVNRPGNDGLTPLHAACISGSISCILVLLSSKVADLNARGPGGNTPLHMCAELGLTACAAFLSLAGCNPTQCNDEGFMPLHVAQRLENVGCVEVLSATPQNLIAVARALERKPGIPQPRPMG